ncbi:MerR family transcriptional regulator [Reichenbachiella ulvae]|uniref:MerR family transcriptional regulator n=1 Tax=Reichenbachiella ulvae TaxID=2980104 RepID=A0ABT3D089_9BACT|nr:MerR family transcriptional regulator [Reichenbachiella ulvae]MCV9389366.1 MerR family transcriptional regulator [Reichenbachiella ulvae]
MLIGEVVKRTGLSKDTIRFYEKKKLIELYRTDRRSNNYKEYSEEMVQRLLSIKKLKALGFTLNEISEILTMIEENDATCDNIKHRITSKVDLIDQKIRQLKDLKSQLLTGAENCDSTCITPEELNCSIVA